MKARNPEVEGKVLRFFSAIADPTRLKILHALMENPKTVNEIHESIGKQSMTLSAISHQLKLLEQTGVVSFEKKGREKTFRPSENFCWCILNDAYRHFEKNKCGCKSCNSMKRKQG